MSDIIHIYPTRPSGIELAEQIVIPISATRLVLLESMGDQPSYIRFEGDDAREIADDLNARTIRQAYLWVVAHPDHPTAKASKSQIRRRCFAFAMEIRWRPR